MINDNSLVINNNNNNSLVINNNINNNSLWINNNINNNSLWINNNNNSLEITSDIVRNNVRKDLLRDGLVRCTCVKSGCVVGVREPANDDTDTQSYCQSKDRYDDDPR